MSSLFGTTNIIYTLLSIPAFLFVFAIKGYSQAYTAEKLGDSTPRLQGRLTMNPFAHINLWGFIFIILFGIGWGKPINVNTRYFKKIKRDSAIFYASGIIGCIIGGFIMSFIYYLLQFIIFKFYPNAFDQTYTNYFLSIFSSATMVCLFLGNFYLLPIPGLDGYNLITNFLPAKYNYKLYNIEKYSMYIFIGFILLLNIQGIKNIIFWPANTLWLLIDNMWYSFFGLFL